MAGSVERLYSDGTAIKRILLGQPDTTALTAFEDMFRKSMVLASASFFEKTIVDELEAFALDCERPSNLLSRFIRQKALYRQYHQLFDWDTRSAKKFFKWFGSGYFDFMSEQVRTNASLEAAIAAFMEIGSLRNDLVHTDYATFSVDITSDEVYSLYLSASTFVDGIRPSLQEYADKLRGNYKDGGGG